LETKQEEREETERYHFDRHRLSEISKKIAENIFEINTKTIDNSLLIAKDLQELEEIMPRSLNASCNWCSAGGLGFAPPKPYCKDCDASKYRECGR